MLSTHVGGGLSPVTQRVRSSASPTGSNTTNMGRPPLWNLSSQRKVVRLYLYTPLSLEKITKIVYSNHSDDHTPGNASANKKINKLLDNQPRWLHPRTNSDMSRRVNELMQSPTRSNTSGSTSSPESDNAATGSSPFPFPDPQLKVESASSPPGVSFSLSQPLFPAAPPQPDTSRTVQFASVQPSVERRAGDRSFNNPLRCATYLSASTNQTTRSLRDILGDCPDGLIGVVKKLLKRYTLPIHHPVDSLSPVSDEASPPPCWVKDEDAPPTLPNRPYRLPGDFLSLDKLLPQLAHCFPNDEEHIRRTCWCYTRDEVTHSWATADGLSPTGVFLSTQGPHIINPAMRDPFGNTALHFFAARGLWQPLMQAIQLDSYADILNVCNSAGQTFLHVLHRDSFRGEGGPILDLLIVLSQRAFNLWTRDRYGRTFFHILMAEDAPVLRLLAQRGMVTPADVKRDAFNYTPSFNADHTPGISRMNTQAMDLDPITAQTESMASCDENSEAAIAEEARLLKFVRVAEENPRAEYTGGRNGLHCLAAATLSTSSLSRKYSHDKTQAQKRRKKDQKPGDLDSSTERMSLRLVQAKALLKVGVDPNHYDCNGNTPLMAFVANLPEDGDYINGPETLKLLIDYGADVNARNRAGETALHVAVRCGRKLAARALVEGGANVHVRDAAGRSLLGVSDAKMRGSRGENIRDYAHFEACRAWLSGQGRAVQHPTLMQEWGTPGLYTARA